MKWFIFVLRLFGYRTGYVRRLCNKYSCGPWCSESALRLWSPWAVSGGRRDGELPAGHVAGRPDRRRTFGDSRSVRCRLVVATLSPTTQEATTSDGRQSATTGGKRPRKGADPGGKQRLRGAEEHPARGTT